MRSKRATAALMMAAFAIGCLMSEGGLLKPVKAAVFAAKVGELTEPVKQANGFYIFRVEEIVAQPFQDVQATVINELKDGRFREWMTELQKSIDVKLDGETSATQSVPQPPRLAPAK